jgi:hypothetical protein
MKSSRPALVRWALFAVIFTAFPLNAPIANETGKSFNEIMESVAAEGSISNGDGHYWKFVRDSGGAWKVEGARHEVARVIDAGPDAIKIDGFPSNWNANGRFLFSIKKGKCQLKSDHSRHRLKWKC